MIFQNNSFIAFLARYAQQVFTRVLVCLLLCASTASAQRQAESLGRGVIALRKSSTQVYVGWRLLGDDPGTLAFNVYRSTGGATAVKLNSVPLLATTDYTDTTTTTVLGSPNAYFVKPVLNGVEGATSVAFTLPANAPTRQYLIIPRAAPFAGTYAVQLLYAGDVDGDGEYELVGLFDYTGSGTPTEGREVIECYRLDGTFLWRVKLGPNEPTGNDGDGLLAVADFDGDGKADVAARTCYGTVFNDGASITTTNSQEYLSIIDGLTGQERARTGFLPALGPDPTAYWGENERPYYLYMAVAFLDGIHPSFIAARGIGGERLHVYAWDYRDGALTERWHWIATAEEQMETGHNLQVFDVDNDGCDEVVFIGGAIDHDGTFLYNNNLVHGDHFRLFDLDPDRPGFESFAIQQSSALGSILYDALTGKAIKKWYLKTPSDPSRGDAGDVDANYRGAELWSTMPNIWTCQGELIGPHSIFPARGIWWDADVQREIWTGANAGSTAPVINKVNASHGASRLYSVYNDGVTQPYGGFPPFEGDLLGDWREEVVLDTSDHNELRIFSTTIPASNRLYTLMQNPAYRVSTTCRGRCGAPSPDYYLGGGMAPPPPPPMVSADLVWRGGVASNAWNVGATANWRNAATPATYTQGQSVRFDLSGSNAAPILLEGELTPSAVTVYSPIPYVFSGTGTLSGSMPLTKVGAGSLTLSGSHTFSGQTTVWDGALLVNGSLLQSPVTIYGGTWGGAGACGLTGGRVGGSGTFGGGVTLQYGAALTPGAGMGAAGTMTITGTLAEMAGAVACFDLSDDPAGETHANDRINVIGNVVLSGTNTLFINRLNSVLTPGTYTLLTYTGTLTGGLPNLRLAGLPGIPATLATPPGALTLVVPQLRTATNIVWSGASGSLWDLAVTTNWFANALPALFVPGDRVSFGDVGASHPLVTLAAAVTPAAVTFTGSSNYTLTGEGHITGSCGISKTGTGTLTLLTENDYMGSTSVTGGTIEVFSVAEAGYPSSIGASGVSSNNLLLDACTFRLLGGGGSGYTDRGATLGAGGVTFDVADAGAGLTFGGVLTGKGMLAKSGPGTLQFTGSNSYTGGTVIAGGTLSLGTTLANQYGVGSGPVTLLSGTLLMADVQASESANWNLIVPAGGSGLLRPDGRCTLRGSLTGSGTLTVSTPYIRTDFAGDWSQFSGQINLDGDIRLANTYGYGQAHLNLGSCTVYFINTVGSTGTTLDVGSLSGDAGATLRGGPTGGRTLTWRVGGIQTDETFDGRITEQGADTRTAITKVGSGVWTLGGSNTYVGATTVLSGTLRVSTNGTLGTGDLTVSTGAVCVVENTLDAVADDSVLRLNSMGRFSAGAGVNEIVRQLYIDGVMQRCGVWNTTRDPAHFAGEGQVLVLEGAPSAPTALVATAGDAQVALAWTAVYGATNYMVWRSTTSNAGYQMCVTLAETNWLDTSAVNDTTYFYIVAANTNVFGAGAASAEASATPMEPIFDGIWTKAGSGVWSESVNWLGATIARGASRTATFAPAVAVTVTQDLVSCTLGSLVFTNASHTLRGGAITLLAGAAKPVVTVAASRTATLVLDLAGTNGFVKTGAGTLVFSGAKSYSGGTTVQEGELQLSSGAAAGTGPITLEGGVFRMNGANLDYLSLNNSLVIPAGRTATINLPPRVDVSGMLTGTAGSVLNLVVSYTRDDVSGNWSTFAGHLNVSTVDGSDDFRFANGNAGLPLAFVHLAAGVKFYLANHFYGNCSFPIGTLSGATNCSLSSGSDVSGRICTYQVGARNEDSVFAGRISNNTGATALTKAGTGTLTLAYTNTYTGPTTISNGTLRVGVAHALAPGSALTLFPGATLDLNGFDAEAVSLAGTGTLKVSAAGTLTLAGALSANLVVSVNPVGLHVAQTYTLVTCAGRPSGNYTCTLPYPWALRVKDNELLLYASKGTVLMAN